MATLRVSLRPNSVAAAQQDFPDLKAVPARMPVTNTLVWVRMK